MIFGAFDASRMQSWESNSDLPDRSRIGSTHSDK
jgi:hypothetical protein